MNDYKTKPIEIVTWKSCMYSSVWLITRVKDGCIYKTEPLGYILTTDKKQFEATFPDTEFGYSYSSVSISRADKISLDVIEI